MSTVVLEVPEDTFSQFDFPAGEFGRNALIAACVKWVEAGRLSQSRASEICSLSRTDFLHAMSEYQVSPFQESAAELKEALLRG